jgi:pyruvate kinase
MFYSLNQIKQELERLNISMLNCEQEYNVMLEKINPAQKLSAVNLLHYLNLRSLDIKELQLHLHQEGYSSLTNSEAYIRSQVVSILKHFGNYEGCAPTFDGSKKILEERAKVLFGYSSEMNIPSLMVTLKASHASDVLMVKKLLRTGMNIARINCAHDNEELWHQMVLNVRKATEITGIPCKIYMDLAGPKIRTKIKGKKKGRVLIEEGDEFYLAEKENFKAKLPVVICAIPGIISQLKEGETVLFDDGLFEAKINFKQNYVAGLEMIRVSAQKPFIKSEKGINFPDSQLSLSALTEIDRKSLNFIREHADLVGYSFVHNTNDLDILQKELQEKKVPVILKIETPEGFRNLPYLLFKAMEEEYYGVMIARGDLAVELGFEKLSQTQEEISLLCEAAHTPMIWATQVLENMNKTGLATRSEISDASMGIAAECVMLNKGDHTVRALKALKTILQQSSIHHSKKRYLLRPLKIARDFFYKD